MISAISLLPVLTKVFESSIPPATPVGVLRQKGHQTLFPAGYISWIILFRGTYIPIAPGYIGRSFLSRDTYPISTCYIGRITR